jgi:hypothetical protein
MDVRFRGEEPGAVIQRSPHDDGNSSLVIRVPPRLLRDVLPAVTVFKCEVEFVVVQARAVFSEMAATPKMVENRVQVQYKYTIYSRLLNSDL